MDVFEAIRRRRSVRSFEDRPVEQQKLQQVLDAARRAPSAKNRQDWRFVVAQDEELRRRLMEAAHNQDFVGQAPVVLAACGIGTDYTMTCGQPAYLVDVSIALDHITLAARALGLGTCWVGRFKQNQVKEILDIPDEADVVELMPLGYPREWPDAPPRKPLDEIVYYDGWEN